MLFSNHKLRNLSPLPFVFGTLTLPSILSIPWHWTPTHPLVSPSIMILPPWSQVHISSFKLSQKVSFISLLLPSTGTEYGMINNVLIPTNNNLSCMDFNMPYVKFTKPGNRYVSSPIKIYQKELEIKYNCSNSNSIIITRILCKVFCYIHRP